MIRLISVLGVAALLLISGQAGADDKAESLPGPEAATEATTDIEEPPLSCEEAQSFKQCSAACRQKFPKKKKKKQADPTKPVPSIHGWWTIGVGGALLITGGALGAYTLKLNSDLEGKCPGGDCPPSMHSDLDKRDNLSITSTILIGAGLAATTVGILILTVFKSEKQEANQELAIAPLAGPGLAGASLEWRF